MTDNVVASTILNQVESRPRTFQGNVVKLGMGSRTFRLCCDHYYKPGKYYQAVDEGRITDCKIHLINLLLCNQFLSDTDVCVNC